jgi:MOSC domain-containing protein YiiM
MAEVVHVFICLAHRLPMRAVPEAFAEADKGFAQCAHGRRGSKRQILLIEQETLDELNIAPGAVKENIVTRGIVLRGMRHGQRLRVGGALLEVTLPCEPCKRMDDIRPGLQKLLRGRRGMLCRVVEGGLIRTGDTIEQLETVPAA